MKMDTSGEELLFEEIPEEIVYYQIVPFLDAKSLATFERVCKKFRENSPLWWYNLLHNDCKITYINKIEMITVAKALFKRQSFYFRPPRHIGKEIIIFGLEQLCKTQWKILVSFSYSKGVFSGPLSLYI